MNCYVLFGLVAVATVHALPLFEDDRIRSGADILLALQKAESAVRDGVTRREPIADGLRPIACDLIMHAAKEPVGSGAPMRLVFAALEDANIGLSKLTCVRAYSQVTQAPASLPEFLRCLRREGSRHARHRRSALRLYAARVHGRARYLHLKGCVLRIACCLVHVCALRTRAGAHALCHGGGRGS